MTRILSDKEFGELIGQTAAYVSKLRNRGCGPTYIRLSGKRAVYRQEDVDAWIQEHTVTPPHTHLPTKDASENNGIEIRRKPNGHAPRGYRRRNGGRGGTGIPAR